MRRFVLFCVAMAVATLEVKAADQAMVSEVSRTAPEVYQQHLAGLLTPATDVLQGRTAFPDDTNGGVVLLTESITYRDAQGTLFRLIHCVYHAVNESAVKSVGNDTYRYDRDRESIFLIDACTLLPDGSRQPVDKQGAFIQTPQRNANQALYSSSAELNIIFPKVAPGATTEAIVLIRENTPVLPGHFAFSRCFASTWPVFMRRSVIDLPAEEWKRMHTHVNMPGVPDAQTDTLPDGRERRQWIKRNIAAAKWEDNAPDFECIHPTLWLTTVPDWDEIARWYSRLVADRSELGEELEKQIDGWTGSLTDRRAIIELLSAKVANDVRYTGLEFGLAGYQPYPCRDVWHNRYGDCKDKANLLRAMLARKGIKSHLVLLSTETLGRFEKNSPSWHQFNHCILAIEPEHPTDGYIFCDPTVMYLPAGVLPMADKAREMLVIHEDRAEWVNTADTLDTSINISAELDMTADGELSGWFNFGAKGSDAAHYSSYFARQDKDDLTRDLQKYAAQFFPGVAVIDSDFPAPAQVVRECAARAFLVRPARAATGQTLRFPFPPGWLPDVEDSGGQRRFPYGSGRREMTLHVTFALPAGWHAENLPPPFSAPSDGAKFSARWSAEAGKITAKLSWFPERAELSPAEYSAMQQSVRALKAWLDRPALLATASGPNPAATPQSAAATGDLPGFPILPSGEGQLRLLEEKFPPGKNTPQRRLALNKVLQWFPADADTVFDASVKLALLDWENNGTDKQAAATLAGLLSRYGAKISTTNLGWGEYLEARARWFDRKDPAAIDKLESLAADPRHSPYRRGWCGFSAGKFLLPDNPQRALKILLAHEHTNADSRGDITGLIGVSLALLGDLDRMKTWVDALIKTDGSNADPFLARAVDQIISTKMPLSPEAVEKALARFGQLAPSETEFPATRKILSDHALLGRITAARKKYVQELQAWMKKHPPAWWHGPDSPNPAKPETKTEDLIAQIKARNNAGDAPGTLKPIFQLLLHHHTDYATFAKYNSWAIWWLDRSKADAALIDLMGKHTLALPINGTNDIPDAWLSLAQYYSRVQRPDEARRIFRLIFDNAKVEDYQRAEAGGELGKLELAEGRVDAALAALAGIEPLQNRHRKGADYLCLALIINIERGDYRRALELLGAIGKHEEKYIKETRHQLVIEHLLRAGQDPEKLLAYWRHSEKAHRQWNELLAKHGLKPGRPDQPPLETDFTALNKRIASAADDKNSKQYLRELDTYARLARCVPIFCIDLSQQILKSEPLGNTLYHALLEQVLTRVVGLEPVDPKFDNGAKVWEIIALSTLGRDPEAIPKAQALYSQLGVSNRSGESALRLWAIMTRNTPDEEIPLKEILRVFAGDTKLELRDDLARTYSDAIFDDPSRIADHKAFLLKETARPGFNPKSEHGLVLMQRLNSLKKQGTDAQAFTRFVTAWQRKHAPVWPERVPPTNLDDPRFAAFNASPAEAGDGISRAEAAKFNLLLALDENHSDEVRTDAFVKLALDVAARTANEADLVEIVTATLRQENIPDNVRFSLLYRAIYTLIASQNIEKIQPLLDDPAFTKIREDFRASITACLDALKLCAERKDNWPAQAVTRLTDKPVDYLRRTTLFNVLNRIQVAGGEKQPADLLPLFDKLTVLPELQLTPAALRLKITREIREQQKLASFTLPLLELLGALPEARRNPSSKVTRQLTLASLGRLTTRERFDLVVHGLRTGLFDRHSIKDGLGILRTCREVRRAHPEMGLDILSLLSRSQLDDELRSELLAKAAFISDPDQPAIRTRLLRALDDWESAPKAKSFPKTMKEIAYIKASVALRSSTETRPASLFDKLDASGVDLDIRKSFQFTFHGSRGNRDECLSLLDTLSPEQLLVADVYPFARDLMLQTNRKNEARLIEQSLREKITGLLPDIWFDPANWKHGRKTLQLIEMCLAHELLDDAWFASADAELADSFDRDQLLLFRGLFRKDWKTVHKAADAILDAGPDFYDYYFDRALAAHHLGRDKQAVKDLQVFLQYARGEPTSQAARELLEKLTAR